jgi:hypothetical protein
MSMVTIEVRDVPEDLYEVLLADANERGLTMQQYLLALLEDEAQCIRSRGRRDRGDGQ